MKTSGLAFHSRAGRVRAKGPVARTTPDAPLAIYRAWTWEWLS